jgi:hypothetical protein
MLKRISLCLLMLILLVTCKKEKKTAIYNFNMLGTWSLSSYNTNYGAGVNASVAQYPCMAYNTMTFYRDSTSSQAYTGIDTCFITPHGNGAQYYGLPGLLALPSKWSLKGNVIHVIYQSNQSTSQIVPGIVSSVNGKLQIAFKDTVISGGKTYYVNSLEVQE